MKLKCFLFIILFINIFSINVYSENKDIDGIIKVGVYNREPYYSIDSDGNVSGYYHDFLNLLKEEYKFEYEYIIYDFEDAMKDLENGKIDIMLGVSITPERIDKLIFNKNFIARDKLALLTNKDIIFDDLENLDGLRIGLVGGTSSAHTIVGLFGATNIDVEPVCGRNWEEIEQLLEDDKVDIILYNNYNSYKKNEYKSLYEIEGDRVYISANKNRADILENMDEAIKRFNTESPNKINGLHNKYFNEDYNKMLLQKKFYL